VHCWETPKVVRARSCAAALCVCESEESGVERSLRERRGKSTSR